jgi:Arabinose efflux permease
MAQLSLTMSMLGLSVGQLFVGPLSDKYGRKKLLLVCLLLFVCGTVACIVAPNIVTFNVFRLLQGMAASGGIVIARSISADSYRGPVLTKFLADGERCERSRSDYSSGARRILAEFHELEGNFCGVASVRCIAALYVREIPGIAPGKRRSKKSVFASFSLYAKVFKNRAYVSYFLVCTFPMIILFGYIASSPFIYQKIYGLSPVGFSLCFALNAVFTAIGCALSGKVGNEYKALKIAGTGMFVFAIAVAVALMTHALLPILQVAFMGLTFMFGMSQPPANALALNAERANAGTAAAAIGASGFLMGGIVSPLVGMGDIATSVSIVLVVGAVLTLVSVLASGFTMHKRHSES